jgi:hypothetical protein
VAKKGRAISMSGIAAFLAGYYCVAVMAESAALSDA